MTITLRSTSLHSSSHVLLGFLFLFFATVQALHLPNDPPSNSLNSRLSSDNYYLLSRDVYAPRMTNPIEGTIWTIGSNVTVEWDTRNPPKNITNPIGKVILGHYDEDDENENLDLKNLLASGFEMSSGSVVIEVPQVEPGDNYFIVLFGDSGNKSPRITIQDPISIPLLPAPFDIFKRVFAI